MKRVISLLVCLSIVVGLFSGMNISVFAAGELIIDPNRTMYQASRYSREFQKIFGNPTSSFAYQYYTSMRQDEAFMNSVWAWEATHIVTDPSYSAQTGELHKKDLYKLAIFDLLNVNNSADELIAVQESYVVEITDYLADEIGLDVDVKNFKSITNVADLTDEMVDAVSAKSMIDTAGNITIILNASANLLDAINAAACYQAIANRQDGTKELLTTISQLPDGALGTYFSDNDLNELRLAAKECISYYDGAYNNVLERILAGKEPYSAAAIKTLTEVAMDLAWNSICAAIPGVREAMLVLQGMRFLGNTVFNLDAKTKAFYQLGAVVAFEIAVRKVMTDASYDYLNHSNLHKANFYMQAVNMYKKTVLLGFDYSIDLLELVASSAGTILFDWLTHNYSECIELINDLTNKKNQKSLMYAQFDSIVSKDYRELYFKNYNETLSQFNNQEIVRLESISLTQIKPINMGDTDYIGNYFSIGKAPSNANEIFFEVYTSENEDVIKINDYGFIEVLKEGPCTIVCQAKFGIEARITVTVGSAPSDDTPHDYLSDFEYEINDDNQTATITWYKGANTRVIIPSKIDGYTVTAIGEWAFAECLNLISITIPDSVTTIGQNAFDTCECLTNVTIGNGVTNIGSFAFWFCDSLTSITIPDSVISIGDGAFEYCASLTSITIGNGVKTIGISAFYGCDSLISITIPNSVNSIGNYAFYGCDRLNSVTIGNGLTSIGSSVFEDCGSLTNVTIGGSVTVISSCAFRYCTSLTSITIPDSVTYIGEDAFYACNSLTSITIGNGVTRISSYAFSYCISLTDVYITDLSAWWKISFGDYAANPMSYAGDHLHILDENGNEVTQFVLDSSLTEIPYGAFVNCDSLISVAIPDSVTSIGEDAFYGCDSLTSITIPDSVTSIGGGAFKDCACLTSVTIGNGVTSIGEETFDGCTSLTSITIPDSVTSIGKDSFDYCTSLTSITIPNSVTSIGSYAFDDCDSLTDVYYDGTRAQWERISIGSGNGCLTNATIHTTDVASIVGISIKTQPTKTVYQIGESLNTAGLTLTATYSDGSTQTVTEGFSVSGFSSASAGTKTITVTYEGMTISFTVTVKEPTLSAISVRTRPAKAEYQIGDSLDTTGLTLTATYSNGSTQTVTSGFTVSGFDSATEGTKTITVSYQGKTTTFQVTVEPNVESGIDYLAYRIEDDRVTITGTTDSTPKELVIPDTIEGYPVRAIATSAFEGNWDLTSVVIPDGVTTIGGQAFCYCWRLTSVTIGSGVTSIGTGAFRYCSSLNGIWVDEGNQYYSNDAEGVLFDKNKMDLIAAPGKIAGSYMIPDGVINIGKYAFEGRQGLTNITIPNSVITIGDNAFYYVNGITQITIPDGVTTIGEYAFAMCEGLTEVILPDSVTTIGDYAFDSCESLTDVYYDGTSGQWQAISIGSDNECLIEATIHYPEHEHICIYSSDGNATCTEDGTETGICLLCGETDTRIEVGSKLGHSFTNYVSNNDATYDADGTKTAKCDRCDETDTVTDPGTKLDALNGWVQESGKWYFYENNVKHTGWLKSGSTYYYLKTDGAMATGWVSDGGKWYYMDASGKMATGWVQDNGKWYYMNTSGAMQTGWQKISNVWYYFQSSGVMQTGWLKSGNTYYYFNTSGAMQTGWMKDGNTWYYFQSSGAMQTGWMKSGSTYYYFLSSGAMATGWVKDGNTWYYMNTSGAMATGWLKLGNTWYYLQPSGAMVTGSLQIGTKVYNFNSSGACLNP